MAVTVKSPDMDRLSKQVQQASADLEKELSKAAEAALKNLRPDVKQSALEVLPRRGGLARYVADLAMPVEQIRGGAELKTLSRSNLRLMNRGKIRHPVFADKERKTRDQWKWVTQPIIRGWFDRPTKAATPEIRRDIQKAMERFVQKILR